MSEYLSCDLVSPTEYTAGEELSFNLHFEAPGDTVPQKFYILGALYTDTTYLSGTLFGLLKAAEVDYAVNSDTYISLWELEPEEVVDLPCRLTLDRSDCILALFLMKMAGDAPNLDTDEVVDQVQVQLASPVPAWEQITQSMIPVVGVVMVLALVGMMVSGMFRGEFR